MRVCVRYSGIGYARAASVTRLCKRAGGRGRGRPAFSTRCRHTPRALVAHRPTGTHHATAQQDTPHDDTGGGGGGWGRNVVMVVVVVVVVVMGVMGVVIASRAHRAGRARKARRACRASHTRWAAQNPYHTLRAGPATHAGHRGRVWCVQGQPESGATHTGPGHGGPATHAGPGPAIYANHAGGVRCVDSFGSTC